MTDTPSRENSHGLAATVRAIVRQAESDGLRLGGGDGAALTALLRQHGFDAPALRAAAPPLARLLAELLAPGRLDQIGRRDIS